MNSPRKFGPTQEDYDTAIAFAQGERLHCRWHVPQSREPRCDWHGGEHREGLSRVDGRCISTRQRTAPSSLPTASPPSIFPSSYGTLPDWTTIPFRIRPGLSRNTGATKSGATVGSGPSASFLGSDMRAAYYGGTALTGSGQSLGLLEYYGTDLADLNTYFTNAGQTNNVPITLLSTDGTSTSCVDSRAGGDCDDTEQTLDMTQAMGMAPGLSSLVMYVGSTDSAIFNAMATHSPLNAQLSSSWTWSPADPNTDNPYFEEFAVQGQNLFQAAGDSGKWTRRAQLRRSIRRMTYM